MIQYYYESDTMGTWGTNVTEDDLSSDVIHDFMDAFNEGKHPVEIRKALEHAYASSLGNTDEKHVFWLALAKVQWDVGALDEDVFKKVKTIVESDVDLISWRERGTSDKNLELRREALQSFLDKITVPKKNPKKIKKKILRSSHYEKGDVFAFQLSDGRYSAAVVIDAEKQTEYGANVVVMLDLVLGKKPTIDDVVVSNVLIATYQSIRKGREFDDRVKVAHYSIYKPRKDIKPGEVVGRIKVKKIKEKASFYSCWEQFTSSFEQSIKRKSGMRMSLKRFIGYNLFQRIKTG